MPTTPSPIPNKDVSFCPTPIFPFLIKLCLQSPIKMPKAARILRSFPIYSRDTFIRISLYYPTPFWINIPLSFYPSTNNYLCLINCSEDAKIFHRLTLCLFDPLILAKFPTKLYKGCWSFPNPKLILFWVFFSVFFLSFYLFLALLFFLLSLFSFYFLI